MSAAGVNSSTASHQGAGPGSTPRAALHFIRVRPIPVQIAKILLVLYHYLHSIPGGTMLAFGVFQGEELLGALTLGVGPFNSHSLVAGAKAENCLTLTRLWLADSLPRNSESRVLGVVLRSLRKHTDLKFLVTYADPSQGHLGTIYQATGWLYTGVSQATPKYDIGDGKIHHSRSLAHAYGTGSVRYLGGHGVEVKLVDQTNKHRYVYILDPAWRDRLRVPALPYPKREERDESK